MTSLSRAFTILAAVTILSSCIKKEEALVDDGPKADTNAIATAEAEALEDKSLLDANIGDFVVFEESAQPFNSEIQTLSFLTAQVTERNESPLFYELAILRRKIDADGRTELSTSMDRCKVYKDTGETTCAPANYEPFGNPVAAQSLSPLGTKPNLFTQNRELTVHNYSRSEVLRLPPDLVRGAPNCAETPNCALRTTQIQYDVIVRENGGRQRFRILREFSPDAPAMGMETKFCQSSIQIISGRQIPVNLCYSLVNYKYGKRSSVGWDEIKKALFNANGSRSLSNATTQDVSLRLHARRVGTEPYSTREVQSDVLKVQAGELSVRIRESDSSGQTIRDEVKACKESSPDLDCIGYPLNDPSLIPHPNGKTQYFQLSVANYNAPLPDPVKARRGCTDDKQCPMKATLVRFERQDELNGKVVRTIHALEVAPEVPVLNSLSFRCSRGVVGAWPALQSVRDCLILTDFLP